MLALRWCVRKMRRSLQIYWYRCLIKTVIKKSAQWGITAHEAPLKNKKEKRNACCCQYLNTFSLWNLACCGTGFSSEYLYCATADSKLLAPRLKLTASGMSKRSFMRGGGGYHCFIFYPWPLQFIDACPRFMHFQFLVAQRVFNVLCRVLTLVHWYGHWV